jgi:hypothetical protein
MLYRFQQCVACQQFGAKKGIDIGPIHAGHDGAFVQVCNGQTMQRRAMLEAKTLE